MDVPKVYDPGTDNLVPVTQEQVDRMGLLIECYGIMGKVARAFYGPDNKLAEIVKDLRSLHQKYH